MQVKQKITSFFGINNEIKQYVNSFENEELLNHLIKEELKKIERLISEDKLNDARMQIDTILCQKEALPNELELKLKFLKGRIELELKNYCIVESMIKSLAQKEDGIGYSLELKYQFSLSKNDESLMEETIKKLEENKENHINIILKKVKFYTYNGNFTKVLDLVNYIESEGIEDKNIYYYISISYLNLKDYPNVKKFAKKALDNGIGEIGKYICILSDVNPVIERRGIIMTISENERKLLDSKVKELISIIDKVPKELYIEINLLIINIYLIIDIENAKNMIDEKDEIINSTLAGKFLKATVEEESKNYDSARDIYLDILKTQFSEEVFICAASCIMVNSDYKLYIELFEKYRTKIVDNNFILNEFYLKSIKKVYSTKKMMQEIENMKDQYKYNVRFNIFVINNCDLKIDKYKELIKLESMIYDSNEFDRWYLSQSLCNIDKFDDAIRIIKPLLKYKTILIDTIRKVMSSNKKEYYIDLIKEIDKYNDISLMKYKRDMLYCLNEKEESKRIAKYIYESENSKQSLCTLIDLKLEMNDSSGIEELLCKLIPSKNAMDYMRIACGYALLGNFEKSNTYSYESIFMTKGIVDKKIYASYISLCLNKSILNKEVIITIDKVKEDTVVVLKNDIKTKKICLNAEVKYQINEEVFGCLHIERDSTLWVDLIGQRIGDRIEYSGEQFIIESIVDKQLMISQYCFSKLDSVSDILPIQAFTIDEFPKVMKEISESSEKSYKMKFDLYEFKNNDIGLPFSKIFYGNDLKLSIELLNFILLNNQYSLYIGMYSEENNELDKFVLSWQTLLLLEHYDMLDLLNIDSQKYYVTKSLKNEVLTSIIRIKSNIKQLKIGYSTKSEMLFKDEVDYSEILEKLKKIFKTIQNINTEDVSYDIRDTLVNISRDIISDIDIDGLYLASNIKATIVLDDLFTQKLINSSENIQSLKYVNISYFMKILSNINYSRYCDILKLMLDNKVKYIIEKESFKHIIQNYKKNGNTIEWFKEFIKAIDLDDEYLRNTVIEAYEDLSSIDSLDEYKDEFNIIREILSLI